MKKKWCCLGSIQYTAFIQKSSTLGPGCIGYYELYAVRNKTLVLKLARVDAVLDFILKIQMFGMCRKQINKREHHNMH